MIVPMRHVTVFCTRASSEATVDALRDVGVLHLDQAPVDTPRLRDAQARVQEAEQALNLLDATARAHRNRPTAGAPLLKLAAHEILARGHTLAELEVERGIASREIDRIMPFGDFDPSACAALSAAGVPVVLFRAAHEHLPVSRAGAMALVLATRPDDCFGVQIGSAELPAGAESMPLPQARLSVLQDRLQALVAKQRLLTDDLLRANRQVLLSERACLRDTLDFAAAAEGMAAQGPVSWITGFCPVDTLGAVQTAARSRGWGWMAREPLPGEAVPTLLRPPRLFRPVQALFDMLGIAPAYTETDISVVFYAFFGLFFAMLVGDAGYGLILLAAVILARRRFRRAPAAPFVLLTVFALATIAWGVLTATYFGIPARLLPGFLQHGASRWLSVQSNIMRLCFTLGAVHLSLARLWSAAELFPDRKFLAQAGWVGVIWTMYSAACLIVVPGFKFPPFMFAVGGVSVLTIALFMLNRNELREKGIELAMLPLTIIGSLGDVISYVRLFAVGLAGVKVAENFNEMSVSLPLPLWVKLPVMLLILLLGHGLNLAMGALSILVHAVRLNTLEFSAHKGVSWSGFVYRPLRQARAVGETPHAPVSTTCKV